MDDQNILRIILQNARTMQERTNLRRQNVNETASHDSESLEILDEPDLIAILANLVESHKKLCDSFKKILEETG
jgi:hypothetical protein